MAYDASKFIQASIDDVIWTLGQAVAVVVVVIFLFLGSIRSVLIPIVTIPLSLIGAGTLMLAMGFSLNLLTLLAMVLAIGLVVDDAIVVVENVFRHIEEGKSPIQSALIGAREIAGPVIAMTITLAAVYAPIGFLGGVTGTLFREFAFTLAAAVIVSGVVALTLSPVMSAALLSRSVLHSRFAQAITNGFSAIERWYERRPRKQPRLPARHRDFGGGRHRQPRVSLLERDEGTRAAGRPGHRPWRRQRTAIRQSRLYAGLPEAA